MIPKNTHLVRWGTRLLLFNLFMFVALYLGGMFYLILENGEAHQTQVMVPALAGTGAFLVWASITKVLSEVTKKEMSRLLKTPIGSLLVTSVWLFLILSLK